MLKNRVITLSPMPKNYKNGTASLQHEEFNALQEGNVDEVMIIDRVNGTQISFSPDQVVRHCKLKRYTTLNRRGGRFLKYIILFHFNKALSLNVSL